MQRHIQLRKLIRKLFSVGVRTIDQLDIQTAFLHGLLEPDKVCYMDQPEGFVESGKEDCVWELQKGLYGMKQGGLVWNRTMNDAMLSWGFKRLKCEHCVYYCRTTLGILLVAVHVDGWVDGRFCKRSAVARESKTAR
jgi:5'-3' exoribonuclease 2